MSFIDDLNKLQELHASGALNDGEFAQAQARLLDQPSDAPQNRGVEADLARLTRESAIARLDREWMIEREKYMVVGKYGRHLPGESRAASYVISIIASGFVLVWIVAATSMGAPTIFPLFGIAMIGMFIFNATSSSNKAEAYKQAEAEYKMRRARLSDE